MKRILFIILLLPTFCFAQTPSAVGKIQQNQTARDTVYVIATGQSNLWGATTATGLDTASDWRVQIWQHAQTTPAWVVAHLNQRPFRSTGYNSVDGGDGHPEWNGSTNELFYLGKKIARERNVIVRIVMAVGDGASMGGWFASGVKQKYLDSLLDRSSASGITRVDLMVWHQGENNYSGYAGTYKRDIDSIKATMRRQPYFKSSTPIVVVGMPKIEDGADIAFTSLDTLLQSLDSWDDPFVAYAHTNNLLIDNNGVHYDTTSLKTIGEERIYQAWQSLPKKNSSLYSPLNHNTFNSDTMSFVPFDRTSGTITNTNNEWTMANNSYMVDTTYGITGDGFIEYDMINSLGIPIMSLDTNKTLNYYSNGSIIVQKYIAYINSGVIYAGQVGDASAFGAWSGTNVDAIRLERTDSIVKLKIRVKDNYHTLYEFTSKYGGTLYAKMSAYGGTCVVVGCKRNVIDNTILVYSGGDRSYKKIDSNYGDIGAGSSSNYQPPYIIQFRPGISANAPAAGDSIFRRDTLIGKWIDLIREGEDQFYNDAQYGYLIDSAVGRVTVHPPFTYGERVKLRVSHYWTDTASIGAAPLELEDIPFTTLNNISDIGSNVWQSSTSGWGGYALSSKHLLADGYIQLTVQASDAKYSKLGFNTSNTNEDGSGYEFGMYITSGALQAVNNGVEVDVGISLAVGDIVRVRRAGNHFYLEKSTDGGDNWVDVYVDGYSTSTATVYVNLNVYQLGGGTEGKAYYPKGYGLTL